MNRITRFAIKNFRCFREIDVAFSAVSPLTVLIGLNGSGKTTFLQAVDFVGALMRGNIEDWLKARNWTLQFLPTKFSSQARKALIEMTVEGQIELSEAPFRVKRFTWSSAFNANPTQNRCTSEKMVLFDEQTDECIEAVRLADGKLFINHVPLDLHFSYTGSVLSQLNEKIKSSIPGLEEVHRFLAAVHSFDPLSTRNLRRASFPASTIGMNGENLAGYLDSLSKKQQIELSQPLHDFYNWISHIETVNLESGKKALRLVETIGKSCNKKNGHYVDSYFKRSAVNTNDGTLRLIAVLAATRFAQGVTLFDEIENGFNPHVIEKLIELLYLSPQQTVVSTHSPEVLQYIHKDDLERTVKFFYRKNDGTAGVADFFQAEQPARNLRRLLPGEAFLDTDLEELAKLLCRAQEASVASKPEPRISP